jgi:hypothetical protein
MISHAEPDDIRNDPAQGLIPGVAALPLPLPLLAIRGQFIICKVMKAKINNLSGTFPEKCKAKTISHSQSEQNVDTVVNAAYSHLPNLGRGCFWSVFKI